MKNKMIVFILPIIVLNSYTSYAEEHIDRICINRFDIEDCIREYNSLPTLRSPPKLVDDKPITIKVVPYKKPYRTKRELDTYCLDVLCIEDQ